MSEPRYNPEAQLTTSERPSMETAAAYPLMFDPIYKERIWGARNFERLFGRRLPAGVEIGERLGTGRPCRGHQRGDQRAVAAGR